MNDGSSLREFYEASPDAIVVVDRTGHILFANGRVEPLLGYLPHELVGQPHNLLMPARYRDTHALHLDRFMREPTARMMGVGLALLASRKDGSEFKTEISLSPYHAPDGSVVIVAIRDHEALHPRTSLLEAENTVLRDMLGQVRLDSTRLLLQAGIEATEHAAAQRLQALLLEELHHRMKNMLATVVGITTQTMRTSATLEEAQLAVSSRLVAMGSAQDLLLRTGESGAELADVINVAIEAFADYPSDDHAPQRFVLENARIEIGSGAIRTAWPCVPTRRAAGSPASASCQLRMWQRRRVFENLDRFIHLSFHGSASGPGWKDSRGRLQPKAVIR